mmetsp:Transcript_31344/g.78611  ORF Transcript_31344/g.78611 Transcript_31344/m.78611 type:complete len:189 (+) Transcript_31344:1619-2185(+)
MRFGLQGLLRAHSLALPHQVELRVLRVHTSLLIRQHLRIHRCRLGRPAVLVVVVVVGQVVLVELLLLHELHVVVVELMRSLRLRMSLRLRLRLRLRLILRLCEHLHLRLADGILAHFLEARFRQRVRHGCGGRWLRRTLAAADAGTVLDLTRVRQFLFCGAYLKKVSTRKLPRCLDAHQEAGETRAET